MFRWCFLNASWHFQYCSTSELRTGFFSQEPCFYKFRKMTLNMFNQHAINCFWAKNRVFTNFVKWLYTCLINMPSIIGRALLIDKLVMNPGLSYVRIKTSYIKYRTENHVIPTHHMTHSKCRRPPGQCRLATTLRWAMSWYFEFR